MKSTEFLIGVTGHRDITSSSEKFARAEIKSLLQQLSELMPDTPIRLISGLADGADRLVAKIALEHGIAVDATLPLPLELYKTDFSDQSYSDLTEILSNPLVKTIEIDIPQGLTQADHAQQGELRDQAYSRLSTLLIKRCSLLITMWDGVPSTLTGGTSDTLMRYLSRKEQIAGNDINFIDSMPRGAIPDAYAYWIPVERDNSVSKPDQKQSFFLSGLTGLDFVVRQDKMPESLSKEVADLNEFNFQALELGKSGVPETTWGLSDALDSEQIKSRQDELGSIEAEYKKADTLAMYFQTRSDRLFKIYSYMAGIMGLAFLVYAKIAALKFFILIYLGIFLFGFLSYRMVHKKHWFSKHLMYRLIAEALRTKYYLTLAGLGNALSAQALAESTRASQFAGFSWIVHVFRSLETNNLEQHPESDDDILWLKTTQHVWIEDQSGYFAKKTKHLHYEHHRVEKTKTYLLMGLFAAGLALLFFKYPMAAMIVAGDVSVKTILVFLMGLLPLWLGIWEIYAAKMAIKELSWQYNNQASLFSQAELRLKSAKNDNERKRVFTQLAKDSLAETYMWVVQRYHREHEPPTAG